MKQREHGLRLADALMVPTPRKRRDVDRVLEKQTTRFAISTTFEFEGRTVIVVVRPGVWNRLRARLGVWMIRVGQRLLGTKVGQGKLALPDGKHMDF